MKVAETKFDLQAGGSGKGTGWLGFCGHVLLLSKLRSMSWTLRAGYLCLLLNVPFGYGGAALCALMYARTRQGFWPLLGGGIYAFSWIILGIGILICGAALGKRLSPQGICRSWRAWQRLRRLQARRCNQEP